jgi:uncharacterized membrane protein
MFEYEVEINRPVGEVYREFNDPDNLPRWLTGLQRIEPVSGPPGEVGSVSRHVYLEKGRIVELIETVTAVEPEKHFAGRIEGQGVDCAIHVDFIDRGDKTGVRMGSEFRPRGLMMKLMMPFFKGHVRKRQEGDLRKFKELVEAGGG